MELIERSNNSVYLGIIPYEEVLQRTLDADLLIGLYDPEPPNHRWASPNKLFEAMMAKKPIITNSGTLMTERVEGINSGLVVPYGDKLELKKAILAIRDNPGLAKRLGENGYQAYIERYSYNQSRERLLSFYKEIRPL